MFGQLPTIFVALLWACSTVIASNPLGTWNFNSINTTVSGTRFKIPTTDLSLDIGRTLNPIDRSDSLILLAHSIYSAAERDHKGGPSARQPVEMYQFQYRTTQLQMEGIHDRLSSWKAAQIFYGLVVYGAKAGFHHTNFMVMQERVGYIAQVDIV
ncbi:MAG: hypothetical protein Q9212_006010 [Teloschistes hypoglaucus]